jgi:hypothetical protein
MTDVHGLLDPFDTDPGSGASPASDKWLDEQSPFDNGWGSNAATTFKKADVPATKKQKFERLYDLHNGKGESHRSMDITDSYIKNDLETFMSVLELPAHQRSLVRELFQDLDISSNNFGGSRPYEKILLCLCSLVADKKLSEQPNPSIDDRLFVSDRFRNLMDVTGMSSREHRRIRTSIRQKLEYF